MNQNISEIEQVIDKANDRCRSFGSLSAYITRNDTQELVLSFSEDFSYYHNFSLRFVEPQLMVLKNLWNVDTERPVIGIAQGEEAREVNTRFGMIVGGVVFKLVDDEGIVMFIVASDVVLEDKLVKYV